MPLLLNNRDNRDHAGYYPARGEHIAFYDLYLRGIQGKQARNLEQGAECVVASYEGTRDVRFDWYSFSRGDQALA